jgi:hypothetical protein
LNLEIDLNTGNIGSTAGIFAGYSQESEDGDYEYRSHIADMDCKDNEF